MFASRNGVQYILSSGSLAFFLQGIDCLTSLWRWIAINNLGISRVFKLQVLQYGVSLAEESPMLVITPTFQSLGSFTLFSPFCPGMFSYLCDHPVEQQYL